MATSTRSDLWNRPSRNLWDRPSGPERRFFDRRDSLPRVSYPSDPALSDPDLDYTGPSRRRVLFAQTLGVFGVLGTLALAVAAFGPRFPAVKSRMDALANGIVLPWDPKLSAGPEPIALDRSPAPAGIPAPSIVTAETSEPAAVPLEGGASEAAPQAEALESSETTAPSPASTAQSPVEARPGVSSSPAEATVESAPASRQESPAVSREESPAAQDEPALSGEEIEARKQRYEQWLESEGLERIQ